MKENNLNNPSVVNPDRKIPFGIKVGYGCGGTGDAIAYDFIGSFLLFFLTDIAGISPAIAGSILTVGVLWDAVTDPIIGMMCDRNKSKYGKKRPFILFSAVPLAVVMICLFHAVAFDGGGKIAYYIIFVCLFWTAYTVFNIPYFALGGCLTSNTDERTKIRSVAQVLNFVGVFCASAVPSFLVGKFQEAGHTEAQAWQFAVIIIGCFAAFMILFSWRVTRGYELDLEDTTEEVTNNIFREIKEVMCIKPYIYVILAQLFFYASYTIFMASIMYYGDSILGVGETQTAVVYTGITIGGIIVAILLGPICVKFDKRIAYIGCMFIAGAIMIAANWLPMNTILVFTIYAAVCNIGSAGHWTLSYTLLYDIFEIDEYKSGRRREGFLMSYFSLCGKLGGAVAGSMTGWILEFGGYDATAATQSAEALGAIKSLATLWPGIFCILCGLMIIIYPVKKGNFQKLLDALELKRQGKEYSTEGFEKLIK